jgi:hypothetical protein
MIGKPYSGKPNVRFDEGELEIEPTGHYASSLLYCYTQLDEIRCGGNLTKKVTNHVIATDEFGSEDCCYAATQAKIR